MPHVKAKVVKRFFALGKGFSLKKQAYLYAAKRELGSQATDSYHGYDEEAYKAFFKEKFPLDHCDDCPLGAQCKCYEHKWIDDEPKPGVYDPFADDGHYELLPVKAYCNRKRWDYLHERAQQLMAEDEEPK